MGAWIEIYGGLLTSPYMIVAPYMGAWIEIAAQKDCFKALDGRSLHGSVD